MGIDINVYVHKVSNEENVLNSWGQNWSNENNFKDCHNSDVSKYDF